MSVDESGAPDTLRPVSDLSDLVDFLRRGETPRAAWRVGMEHEKIGLHEADLRRVPYAGDRGIGALLERIAELD